MKRLFKEIYEELKLVLRGKTLDTLLSPIIFIILYNIFDILTAAVAASTFALVLLIYRYMIKHKSVYAVIGLFGVILASVFAYISQSATSYFLPDIVTNTFIIGMIVVTLIVDQPLAAYLSHVTRGWPTRWFWREDVKPAYREVTWFWLIYFILRTLFEVNLYLNDQLEELFLVNTLLGAPLMIVVLVTSYIYGIKRLKTLKGPGVDEFIAQKQPPFRGQNRGF
jgi:hypothetical protein